MLFKNTFDDLDAADIVMLDDYFDGFDYDSASHTYLANYIWRDTYQMSWDILGEYMVIASTREMKDEPDHHYVMFPLTKTGEYDVDALKETLGAVFAIASKDDSKVNFYFPYTQLEIAKEVFGIDMVCEDEEGEIPENMKLNGPVIYHDRDSDEYVYLREKLETLSGRKLHGKKNHLNQFLANYDYTYEEITLENIDEVREYMFAKNEYIQGEEPEGYAGVLHAENGAIESLLEFVKERPEKENDCGCPSSEPACRVLTGAIRIDGKIVAATMGEFANTRDHTKVIVHFEKADDRIRGLYQAINNEFVKHLPPEVEFINREEDMGLPSLRQAKESYRPDHMSKKYYVEF